MRRTTARQVRLPLPEAAPLSLASVPCHACGKLGAVVIVVGRNANGAAIDLGFCSIACARTAGWPWLTSEQPKPPKARHPKRGIPHARPQSGAARAEAPVAAPRGPKNPEGPVRASKGLTGA